MRLVRDVAGPLFHLLNRIFEIAHNEVFSPAPVCAEGVQGKSQVAKRQKE